MFLKQHSIIDIYAGFAVCAIDFPIAYILPDKIALKKSVKTVNEIKVNKKDTITLEKS